MSLLRIGTRGSRLAMVQARAVRQALLGADPSLDVELVEIRTTGDRIVDVPLVPGMGQSFFTKEIEDALRDGRVDLAVHSCKDLATVLPDGLVLGAILPREDPRDALITRDGQGLDDLPRGAVVGTASVRRKAFVGLARPDLELRDLRGNVPTRLRKLDEGRVDALVLAGAGLRRLGHGDRIDELLEPHVCLPAASQGAVAVQVREDDAPVTEAVAEIDHPPSRVAVTAERACLRRLEAGCQAPVGCLADDQGGVVTIRASVVTPRGRFDADASGPAGDAEGLGKRCAEELLSALGLPSLRGAGAWAGPAPRRDPA